MILANLHELRSIQKFWEDVVLAKLSCAVLKLPRHWKVKWNSGYGQGVVLTVGSEQVGRG